MIVQEDVLHVITRERERERESVILLALLVVVVQYGRTELANHELLSCVLIVKVPLVEAKATSPP